jgi:hypothetical protein
MRTDGREEVKVAELVASGGDLAVLGVDDVSLAGRERPSTNAAYPR